MSTTTTDIPVHDKKDNTEKETQVVVRAPTGCENFVTVLLVCLSIVMLHVVYPNLVNGYVTRGMTDLYDRMHKIQTEMEQVAIHIESLNIQIMNEAADLRVRIDAISEKSCAAALREDIEYIRKKAESNWLKMGYTLTDGVWRRVQQ